MVEATYLDHDGDLGQLAVYLSHHTPVYAPLKAHRQLTLIGCPPLAALKGYHYFYMSNGF